MIYQFKQPLMIVGFSLLMLASWLVQGADEPTSITQPTPINAAAQPFPTATNVDTPSVNNVDNQADSDSISVPQVSGLDIPADAQSTIIPQDKATDIHVIIDISGSMKQNDPENLRIPALNLIVEMIPEGARAGVWTFGQWVNMLIPPAQVDDAWREKAKQAAKQINSYGLRTNMGEAMEKATWQFETGGDFEQHAILLTDGLVDIADDKDPQQQAKNEAERQRIATQVLKNYQDLGVKIHSIGLSDNADKVLLDKLALETGGSSVIVNSSQELVKAFLKAFEKAAPAVTDQVPLSNDNTFNIDESVQEFTALVFREKGSKPMQLLSPSGKTISQIKGAGENVRWFGESVYDLVTITSPEAGEWKVDAKLDPDNRITVISDLKMDIRNLPNTLFPGQQVDFEVYLHEKGKVIKNPDFLKLMTFEMTMTAESGRSGTKVISDPDKVPEDGLYRESISRLSKEGQYELKIEVDGKTFKRMRKDYIQVRQPIGFEIRKTQVGKNEAYAVRVIPQVAAIEVAKTRVIAKLKGPDQSSIIQAMPWIEEGVWEAVIEPSKGPGEYNIALNIKGSMGENQEFRVKPDPISLTFPIPADFQHEYLADHKGSEQVANETVEESAVKSAEQADPAMAEKEATQDPAAEATKQEETQQEQMDQPEEVAQTQEAEKGKGAQDEMAAEPQAPVEPVMPDLAEKMKQAEAAMESGPADPEEVLTEEQQAVLEPIPYWLYAVIPVSALVLGILGFLIYRKVATKKSSAPAKESNDEPTKKADVSLNDGLDDEDFDEDFDLSGDDDDEMAISIGDDDDDEIESLSDMDELDDSDFDEPAQQDAGPSDTVADDIPDFDENFDVENAEPQDNTSSVIDELDNVLDSLTDDDEENIPQLDEAVEDDIPQLDEAADEFDLGADDPNDLDEVNNEDENAIDAALANLESELDDIDVDALIDDEKKE